MDFLYEIFDWTWHLTPIGDLIWISFIGLMAVLHFICFIYILSSSIGLEDNLTWWQKVLFVCFIWFLPEIIIFIVGLIGYLIL